jgi:hypothetical protein
LTENPKLQGEDGEDEEDQAETTESTESEAKSSEKSDSAPDDGDEPKKEDPAKFTPEQQKIFDRAIGEKTFKMREAERRAEAAERKAADLAAKLPQSARPAIPKAPDQYDADYEEKMAARDQALREAAAYDAKQEAVREQREAAQRQRLQAENDELVEAATAYKERAEKAGVAGPDLQEAGKAIAKFGISDDLAKFIMKDAQGPLMTMYLARNPTHLEKMHSMSPIQVGAYIASDLKPLLATVKTETQAPDPADVLDGGGSPPSKRGPKGATFE